MKKNNVLSLIIILIAIFVSSFKISVMAKETNSIAKGMVVIEGNSGDVLYSKNENLELPMASTTKIVTAIVAIENSSDLDEKFVVSEKAIGIEGTSIYLKSGEKLSLRELLYGLILASGNDCAIAIAEHIAGLDNFVGLMNEFASNLGLKHTNFKNPHGLDEDGHYTSAYDLSMMTAYALKNPIFREIVSTERMVIEKNDLYQARYLKHKNRLLFTDENCIGVKTGFTDNAGRCLVNAHEENGLQIISVVLNCQPMFEECDRLTKLAMSEYMMKEFVLPYNFVSNVEIDKSPKTEIGIITIAGFKKPILKSEENEYEVKYILPDRLVAPIELNQGVGSVQVLYKGDVIYQGELITIEDAQNNDMKYLFDNIIDKWF
ncbi:MAG TPA: D-alanyl-D-alanine carboxypeptidase [Clostridiales bacterium]|nr:D-alanyl-D-alanine carboxypeptidase [Clostridiales bacterium]